MKLPPSSIIINERQRVDIGDIDDLCDSLARLGQLQAILVERIESSGFPTFHLIDGFRRLTAIKRLAWSEVECIEKHSLSDLQRQEMELEADTKRKDRTWQERCLAYRKLHLLKGFGDRTWSQQKLADILGKSVGHVNETLSVALYLEQTKTQENDWAKGLWNCPSFPNAVQYIAKKCEDEIYTEIVRRQKVRDIAAGLQKPSFSGKIHGMNPTESEELFKAPLRKVQWNKRVPALGECKAAIVWENPTLSLQDNLNSVYDISDDGCAIFWIHEPACFRALLDDFDEAGYNVLPFPLIWNKLQGVQHKNQPVQESYQMGIFLSRGGYKNPFTTPKPAVFTEYMPPDYPFIPSKAVLTMLDYVSSEGDKIWLPFGGPVVDVYRTGRVPVWQGEDDDNIKAQFIKQFGQVEFI